MNIRSIAIAGLLPVLFQAAPTIAAEQDFHDIAAAVSAERIERNAMMGHPLRLMGGRAA